MKYSDALDWLYSTQMFGIKLGTENAHRLVQALDAYPEHTRLIHVAGTNGKGSVCAMAESIARTAGYRTGLFTSPHLVRYNERVRINGIDTPDLTIAEGLTTIRELISEWSPHPTFFEITTALALHIFKKEKCEVIVMETGMGGRLDATNIVSPSVSVIAKIDLDHSQWLGETLREIAREKAGIIKDRTPVLTFTQRSEVLEVLQEVAHHRAAPLSVVDQPFEDIPIALSGEHQKWNAALAIKALQTANIDISGRSISEGLLRTNWPGRFQEVRPGIYLDGAHNPSAARALVETWKTAGPAENPTILLGMVADKDVENTIRALAPLAKSWIASEPRSVRALSAEKLALTIRELSSLPVEIAPTLQDALNRRPLPLLICGSLFLVGEALAFYQQASFGRSEWQ